MFEKLAAVEARYEELNELMAQPDVATDHMRLQQIAREQRELEDVVTAYRAYKETERQIEGRGDEEGDGERAEDDGERPRDRRGEPPNAERARDQSAGCKHDGEAEDKLDEQEHQPISDSASPEPSHAATSR